MSASLSDITSDHELSELLRRGGLRVTPQRLVTFRALRELDRHVTADELRDAVSSRLPNVSLPTVYATLELLECLGLIRRIARGEGPVLYEPRVEPHHHVVCTVCGTVSDLDAPLDASPALSAARRRGFEPEHTELVVSGRCRRCAAPPGQPRAGCPAGLP